MIQTKSNKHSTAQFYKHKIGTLLEDLLNPLVTVYRNPALDKKESQHHVAQHNTVNHRLLPNDTSSEMSVLVVLN